MNATSEVQTRSGRARVQGTVFLLLFVAGLALLRLHTWNEPLERDITSYAVVAHEWLQGRSLYTELWSDRAPLITWTYAAAEHLAGYGPAQVYLLWLAASVATLFGVFAAATAGGRDPRVGWWAVALWVVLSCAPTLQANQPNAEVFVNACMIWGLALLLRDPGTGSGVLRAAALGILFALASLYKTHAGVFMAGLLAIAHAGHGWKDPAARGRALRQVKVGLAAAAGVWMVVLGGLAVTGALGAFWNDVVVFVGHYGGNPLANLAAGLHPDRLVPEFMAPLAPLLGVAALGMVGALVDRRKPVSRETLLFLAYGLGVVVLVALPGRFFPHYYQVWLPLLAVVGPRVLSDWASRRNAAPETSHVLCGLLLLIVGTFQVPYYGMSPEEWSRLKYGDWFVKSRRAAGVIDTLLRPGERFYNYGAETGLYFYTQKPLPTGQGWWLPAVYDGPLVRTLLPKVIGELRKNPPDLLVISPYMAQLYPPMGWLLDGYRPMASPAPDLPFRFHVRDGSALDARLGAAKKRPTS